MKNILITGAAGFIGSALSKKLIKNNFVYLVDTKNLKKAKNLTFLKNYSFKNYKYIRKDLTKGTNFLSNLKHIDIIFHCASIIGVNKMINPFVVHNQIVDVSKDLINFFKNKQVLFIYFSSSEIYGNQIKYGEKKGSRIYQFNFNQAFKDIRWVYGESKFFIETCLRYINDKNNKFNYLIIRPFNFLDLIKIKIL